METLDKNRIKVISSDIESALQEVAKKHNLDIRLGSGSFNSANFTTKVECRLKANSKAAMEHNASLAKMMGLPEDIVGKSITIKNEVFKITHLDPKKPKFAVGLKSENGREVFTTVQGVLNYLKINTTTAKKLSDTSNSVSSTAGGLRRMPSPAERKMAEDAGINFNDPYRIIIFSGDAKFTAHLLDKPIKSYNNGILKMMCKRLLDKAPYGSSVVNDNFPI